MAQSSFATRSRSVEGSGCGSRWFARRPPRRAAVSAGTFRNIERLIRRAKERVPVAARLGEGSDADRAGYRQRAIGRVKCGLSELVANALGEKHRPLLIGLLAQHHQLLATKSSHHVGSALLPL